MAASILKRNKIYIWLITLFLLGILISGILLPILIEKEKNNWDKSLVDKIDKIEDSINQIFETRTNLLTEADLELKKNLSSFPSKLSLLTQSVFNVLSNKKYQEFSIQIYDSTQNLIAWNSEPVLDKQDLNKIETYIGQSFFCNQKLYTHLAFADTIEVGEETVFIVLSKPVEKNYSLDSKVEPGENVVDALSNSLSTKVEIIYSPLAQLSKDGRKHSFFILNNFKNKIGVATFDKPSLESALSTISNEITIIQRLLLLAIIILSGTWFSGYIRKLNRKLLLFTIIAIFIALLRYLLFVFEIPSYFIRSSINDPSNFSSVFAFGLVRSPLDFLITILFLLLIVLIGYNYVVEYSHHREKYSKQTKSKLLITVIISVPIFLLFLRGIGAAIRSVIFDSTIHYFKDFSLIPSPPILLMNFNILVLGTCSVIFSVILILLIFAENPYHDKKKTLILYLILFILLQVFAWLFDFVQSEPQGTPVIRILYITIIFALAFVLIFLKDRSWAIFAYFALAGSIVSVSLLNYYNSEIERESLKTTAHELTRTNEDLIEFMVYQTLVQTQQDARAINSFTDWRNFSSNAFIIWTGSLLYKEGISSAVNFFDQSQNFLGGYQTGKFVPFGLIKQHLQEIKDSMKLFRESNIYGNEVTFTGIISLKDNGRTLGYAVVSAVYNEDYFSFADLPKIMLSQRTGISSAVDIDKLKIFDFHNGELVRSYGGVDLSVEEQNQILNADFTSYSEAWLKMNINNESNLLYVLKIDSSTKNRILAITLEEKNFSWNLSDFFKVFFVHIVIITFMILLFALSRLKSTRLVFTSYRTRLIGAFLVISIIPLIIIALYFREITEGKNTQLIEKRLTEMSAQVESYLMLYSSNSIADPYLVYEKAARDLDINYSLYSEKNLLFSSEEVYSEVGLLQSTVNSLAYANCILGKNQRIYLNEKLEDLPINSVYSLANFGNQNIIIKVDDLFNKVSVPLSDVELDIFLFGVFSLAVILLFILSTILADQISSPIRRLTSATKSVGSGDLNVQVSYKTNGEIKELVDGFNMMVKKIEQSQIEIAQMERESAWKEMAKQVAHEIKNPLTPMKLNVQQLIAAYKDKSPKFDSIFEKVTATIISQIETLKNIASEFSNFARMPRLNIEKLNAVEVISEVLNLFEEEKYEINFEFSDKSIMVNADQDQLKRTIINLLRNSIQANAKHISVALTVENKMCKIFVTDDGTGIDPNFIPKVFEENFTTKRSGMGIGLSLAKRFVESVGGNISIEKTSGLGTTLLITLPLAEA